MACNQSTEPVATRDVRLEDASIDEVASLKAEIQTLKAELASMKTSAPAQGPSTSPPKLNQGPELVLPEDDDNLGDPGKWNLLAWVRGAGVHRVITAALQQGVAASTLA